MKKSRFVILVAQTLKVAGVQCSPGGGQGEGVPGKAALEKGHLG